MPGPYKIAQRQVVAEITPVDGLSPAFSVGGFLPYFAQVTGGEITAAGEKVYDGGANFPDTLCAPAEIGDITVTRHYAPERDGAALAAARAKVGSGRYDVKIYVLNCDLKDAATERVYHQALLTGITEMEGDSSSGGPATFALTFAVGAVA